MKKTLLSSAFLFSSLTAYCQCPQPEIIIDNFAGSACTVAFVNADPAGTVMQTECTGRAGSISGAADIWAQKTTPAGGGTATTLGYSGFNNFDNSPGASLITTFSITWDGTDSNTDPNTPTLTGPVLLDFTGKTIQFRASIDDIVPTASVTFVGSVWDAAGNRSDATLMLPGPRTESVSEILNLGAFSGPANLTDIRAIQLKQTTTQGGLDLYIERVSAVCVGSVLPVTLKEFKGSYTERAVDLNWSTTSETNSERFDIESSTTGKNFQQIGSVLAKGEASSELNYNFRYSQILGNTTYFRLKMLDKDGTYAYSRIVALTPDSNDPKLLVIFPTVFSNSLSLKLQANDPGSVVIRILDLDGTIRSNKTAVIEAGENELKLDSVSTLQSGMYIIQVENKEGTQIRKVIKQ